MAAPVAGRFIWHELRTPDPLAAEEFYSTLFGWSFASGAGGLRVIHAGGTDIGSIAGIAPDQPPYWLAFATVEDAGAALAKAHELGGRSFEELRDVPGIGRSAALEDPRGAVFSIYEPAGGPPPEPTAPPPFGAFCWNELLTDDTAAGDRFYTGLFGWETKDYDFQDAGRYRVFRRGDHDAAGMMAIPGNSPHPPHWLSYVRTEEVDETAQRIGEAGGWVLIPPSDLPKIGRVCVAGDPQGGLFALFRRASDGTEHP